MWSSYMNTTIFYIHIEQITNLKKDCFHPGPEDPDENSLSLPIPFGAGGNSLSASGPSGPGRKQIQSGGILNTGAIEALAFNTVPDKVSERPMAVPGPFFFEAPTETVGRCPCSHGGGPLRELDGQCPPSPIAGSPVPCSAPSGALRRNTKGMRAPIGPLRSGFRPPPLAPAKGGRWLRTASAPGLRLPPAASPADSAGSRLCPPGSG